MVFGLTAQIFHTLKLIMVFLKLSIICLSLINKKTRTMKADSFLKISLYLVKDKYNPKSFAFYEVKPQEKRFLRRYISEAVNVTSTV